MTIDEHTPSPQISRGLYGFVLFVTFVFFKLIYFAWIIVPQEWFEYLPYQPPQVYWAAAIPIFLCTALFLFAFCIYPAMHSMHDGELYDLSAITDKYSINPKDKKETRESISIIKIPPSATTKIRTSNSLKNKDNENPIPPVSDLDMYDVCQLLYLKKNK